MKKNLYGKLCGVADDLRMSVVRYPVELLIILYAVVGTALAITVSNASGTCTA